MTTMTHTELQPLLIETGQFLESVIKGQGELNPEQEVNHQANYRYIQSNVATAIRLASEQTASSVTAYILAAHPELVHIEKYDRAIELAGLMADACDAVESVCDEVSTASCDAEEAGRACEDAAAEFRNFQQAESD